jgi:hypothetical protein
VAGAGERRPSEWQHLEAEAKAVQAPWQKAPGVGAVGLVEAPSGRDLVAGPPAAKAEAQRVVDLADADAGRRHGGEHPSYVGRQLGTSAQACKTTLRPTCRVVQELAEASGTRACIRLVSGASGKECAGGGHIGGWTGVVGGTQRQGAAQSGTRRRFRHSGPQRAKPMADVSSG